MEYVFKIEEAHRGFAPSAIMALGYTLGSELASIAYTDAFSAKILLGDARFDDGSVFTVHFFHFEGEKEIATTVYSLYPEQTFKEVFDEVGTYTSDFVENALKEADAYPDGETRGNTKVLNYQGRLIDPLNLVEDDFKNVGMQCAVTLSRLQRFWAQCRESYTVAQHCLSMVALFPNDRRLQKWALVHEIYEALTGIDLPSPIKHSEAYKPYRDAEKRALELFAKIHGIGTSMPEQIKKADRGLLVMEAEALMPYSPFMNWRKHGDLPVGIPYKLGASEEEIRRDFISKWIELFGGL